MGSGNYLYFGSMYLKYIIVIVITHRGTPKAGSSPNIQGRVSIFGSLGPKQLFLNIVFFFCHPSAVF